MTWFAANVNIGPTNSEAKKPPIIEAGVIDANAINKPLTASAVSSAKIIATKSIVSSLNVFICGTPVTF
jgi:hypothetical protein